MEGPGKLFLHCLGFAKLSLFLCHSEMVWWLGWVWRRNRNGLEKWLLFPAVPRGEPDNIKKCEKYWDKKKLLSYKSLLWKFLVAWDSSRGGMVRQTGGRWESGPAGENNCHNFHLTSIASSSSSSVPILIILFLQYLLTLPESPSEPLPKLQKIQQPRGTMCSTTLILGKIGSYSTSTWTLKQLGVCWLLARFYIKDIFATMINLVIDHTKYCMYQHLHSS